VESHSVYSTKISLLCLPGADTNMVRREPAFVMSWRQQAQRLQRGVQTVYLAFKPPRAHWYTNLVAACTAGDLFSPVQLIPSFIPVIGFLDDLVVMFLGVRLLRRIIPPDVLTECRDLAKDVEMRREDEIRSTAAAGAVMVMYLPHY